MNDIPETASHNPDSRCFRRRHKSYANPLSTIFDRSACHIAAVTDMGNPLTSFIGGVAI